GKGRSVEKLFKGFDVPLTRLGTVKAGPKPKVKPKGKGKHKVRVESTEGPGPSLRITEGKKVLLNIPVRDLEDAWTRTFWDIMG
ncbi:MAG: hypothetical protein KAS77_09405, partial [Thermoplasmata archaeon]|nr:hypothetical protein [Thermoplasmata archaeon]